MASPRKLLLTGIMYPPAAGAENLGENCEEFTVDEIDGVVASLAGLPVLVEHDSSRLVGVVKCARRTHANAIEVQAEVAASTPAGQIAIQDILDKKLVGLSLSHSYDLDAKAGSDTARKLKVALCEGSDWRSCASSDSVVVRKRLHELSVCATPARDGCHIHDVVCASAQERHKSTLQERQVPGQQSRESINTTAPPSVQHHLDESFVAVFDCGDERPMATPINATPATPTTSSPPACGGDGIGEDATQLATTTAEQHAAGTAAASDAAMPPPAAVPAELPLVAAPPTAVGVPPATAATAAPTGNDMETTEAMSTMMLQATQQLKQAKEDLHVLRSEQKAAQAKATAAVESKAAELMAEKQRSGTLTKELEQRERTALLGARKTQQATMIDLQKMLAQFNSTSGAVTELPPPAANATEVESLKYETDIATAAIKTLTQNKATAKTMGSRHDQLQRQHTNLGNAVSSFGGALPNHAGLVTASADGADAPASKKQRLGGSLLEWRQLNPHACARQVQAAKIALHDTGRLQGMVSASALGRPWSHARLAEPDRMPCGTVSAFDLHPELAQECLKMNSGCMPSTATTIAIMKSIADAPVDRRY